VLVPTSKLKPTQHTKAAKNLTVDYEAIGKPEPTLPAKTMRIDYIDDITL